MAWMLSLLTGTLKQDLKFTSHCGFGRLMSSLLGQNPCQHISAFISGSAAFSGSPVLVVLWNNCYLLSFFFNKNWQIEKKNRTSLVVWWVRIHQPMQGTWFDSWSGKIPCASEQVNPCATTTEPMLETLGSASADAHAAVTEARGPRGLCPPTGEDTAMRSRCSQE